MGLFETGFAKALGFLIALAGTFYLWAVAGNAVASLIFYAVLALAVLYAFLEVVYKALGITARKRDARESAGYSWIALLALIASFALFILTRSGVFPIIVFIALVFLFIEDIIPKKNDSASVRKSILELVYALDLALVLWLGVTLALNTPTPIDVVTSCSMLPNLDRGDLVILQGGQIQAPEVSISEPIANAGVSVIKDSCTRQFASGQASAVQCTTGARIGDKVVYASKGNDVIVYEPTPSSFGLIIHRAFVRINAADGSFYLTKGDNNEILDQESGAGIAPVPADNVRGKVVAHIPYVGYLKLFLFAQFETPPGCDSVLRSP